MCLGPMKQWQPMRHLDYVVEEGIVTHRLAFKKNARQRAKVSLIDCVAIRVPKTVWHERAERNWRDTCFDPGLKLS